MIITRGDYTYRYNAENDTATITNEKTGVSAKLGKENIKDCNSDNKYIDEIIKKLFLDYTF